MSAGLLIGGGVALLLLLSGKKKSKALPSDKSDDKSKNGETPDNGGGTNGGTNGGGGSGGGGSGGGSGGRRTPPPDLKPDAIWVSKDCKVVAFGDGTGEAWWKKIGEATAKKFIEANYRDPHEIARSMIVSVAPCAAEFPVMEDGLDPMEEEYLREMFLRKFRDVYYLIQFLYNKIANLIDLDTYTMEFSDNCDVEFVGIDWVDSVARRMMRFYLDYMYPVNSGYDHESTHKASELSDVKLEYLWDEDNIAIAVLNRMHPKCASELNDAFKHDKYKAAQFLSKRPGLKALYSELLELFYEVESDRGGGLDFEALDKLG